MGYDGWVTFNDVELFNVSRTAQLAESLGIDTVWLTPESAAWIQEARAGDDWDVITTAPWYDAGYPASAEFAGIIPLSLTGLDDSTLTATPTEYINDGGNPGRARNGTLSLVANVAIVALTERGAEFGKRWLDRVLRGSDSRVFCAGSEMRYFRYVPPGGEFVDVVPEAHRRDVKVTRGTSVTRKRSTACSATWMVTFTLTAGDPYEYGDPITQATDIAGGDTGGPHVQSEGTLAIVQAGCPQYDYTPLYDPLHPALVPSPTAPDFLPDGWDIEDGDTFQRAWVRLTPTEPSGLNLVPLVAITADNDVRMVRVSIWPDDSPINDQCDPLWAVMITYIPGGQQFIIDGEQKASYLNSTILRRVDSLVYGPDANPVEWAAFNDPDGLLVTVDQYNAESSAVHVDLSFIPKSD